MPRVRIRSGYVEFRSCHHCLMPGHLRATCPAPAAPSAGSATGDVQQLFQQQMDAVLKLYNDRMKQAKKEDQQKEEDILHSGHGVCCRTIPKI